MPTNHTIMAQRTSFQLGAVILLFSAVAVSAGMIVVRPEASVGRNALLTLNWFLWLLFAVIYPISVLQSGEVTGTEPMSVSHRSISPARFWVGFVAMTCFWLSILVLVSGLTWAAWYAGPAS